MRVCYRLLQEGCCSCRCGWRAHKAPLQSSRHLTPQRTCSQSTTQGHTYKIPHGVTVCFRFDCLKKVVSLQVDVKTKTKAGFEKMGVEGEDLCYRVQNYKEKKITEISPEYGTLSWLFDHVVLFVLRQDFGEAEISNLNPQLTLHKDISCCQVSVDIPLTWQVLHTLCIGKKTALFSICLFAPVVSSSRKHVTKRDKGKYLADLRSVMHKLLVVDPVLVFHEVISQTSKGQIFHDETKISSSWEKPKKKKREKRVWCKLVDQSLVLLVTVTGEKTEKNTYSI